MIFSKRKKNRIGAHEFSGISSNPKLYSGKLSLKKKLENFSPILVLIMEFASLTPPPPPIMKFSIFFLMKAFHTYKTLRQIYRRNSGGKIIKYKRSWSTNISSTYSGSIKCDDHSLTPCLQGWEPWTRAEWGGARQWKCLRLPDTSHSLPSGVCSISVISAYLANVILRHYTFYDL